MSRVNNIATNNQEIERLKAEHMSRLSVITKKQGKEFDDEIRECNSLLGKINTLEKKNKFMKEGLGPNGVADYHGDINILE